MKGYDFNLCETATDLGIDPDTFADILNDAQGRYENQSGELRHAINLEDTILYVMDRVLDAQEEQKQYDLPNLGASLNTEEEFWSQAGIVVRALQEHERNPEDYTALHDLRADTERLLTLCEEMYIRPIDTHPIVAYLQQISRLIPVVHEVRPHD